MCIVLIYSGLAHRGSDRPCHYRDKGLLKATCGQSIWEIGGSSQLTYTLEYGQTALLLCINLAFVSGRWSFLAFLLLFDSHQLLAAYHLPEYLRARRERMAPTLRSRNPAPIAPTPISTPARAPIRRRTRKLTLADFGKKSKFMRVHQLSAGTLASSKGFTDDNAPIHAVFAKRNWMSSLTEDGYDALKPSMRLASRFLTSRQIRPMFHTMLSHGPLQSLGEKDTDGLMKVTYPDDDCRTDRIIDPAAIQLIEAALDELATCIEFKTHEDGCHTQAGPEGLRPSTARFPQGAASTVYLRSSLIERLADPHEAFFTAQDHPLLIAKWFEFATQLVHEVCHAFQNHVAGDLETEPFFGHDALLAETGFEAENRLLGGQFSIMWNTNEVGHYSWQIHKLPSGQLSELTGIPVLWRWPCRGTWQEYMNYNSGIWERERYIREAPKTDIAWRVMIEHMQPYFTSAFWTAAGQSERLDFLFLPKKVGYPFRFDANDVSMPATISADDLRERGIIGYTVDESTWDIDMVDA